MAWVNLAEDIADDFAAFATPENLAGRVFLGPDGGVGVIQTAVPSPRPTETTTDEDLALLRAELERLQAMSLAQRQRRLEATARNQARWARWRARAAPPVRRLGDCPTRAQQAARAVWGARRAQRAVAEKQRLLGTRWVSLGGTDVQQ